jgi:hypothetical protein
MARGGFDRAPDSQGRIWIRDTIGGKKGWVVKDTETGVVAQVPGITRYRASQRIDDAVGLYKWKPPVANEDK